MDKQMDNARKSDGYFPGMTLAQLKVSVTKDLTIDFTAEKKALMVGEIARREAPGFKHFSTPQVSW